MAQTRWFIIIFNKQSLLKRTKGARLMGRFRFSDTPIASSNITSAEPCLRSLGYLALCRFQNTAVQVCHKDVADGQSQHLAGNDGNQISLLSPLYIRKHIKCSFYVYVYHCISIKSITNPPQWQWNGMFFECSKHRCYDCPA